MPVSINGSSGITTPGLTNSGNETVSGTLNVGGNNISAYSGTSTYAPSWTASIEL